jgi:hypothetical protein
MCQQELPNLSREIERLTYSSFLKGMLNFDGLQVDIGNCKSFQTGYHQSAKDGSFAHFSLKVNTIYKVRNHLKHTCHNLSNHS